MTSISLTIGQLASYVGVTVRAVRHYHQRGLLAEPERDSSGYRRYGTESVLALVRIKILVDAGAPLARIEELLAADPSTFAVSIAEIDSALREQIETLRRRRKQLSTLASSARGYLPIELEDLLDELMEMGISEDFLRVERDGWILLLARFPETTKNWIEQKHRNLADAAYRELFLRYDRARTWDANDRRIDELADDLVAWFTATTPATDSDKMDVALLSVAEAHFSSAACPAWRRLAGVVEGRLGVSGGVRGVFGA